MQIFLNDRSFSENKNAFLFGLYDTLDEQNQEVFVSMDKWLYIQDILLILNEENPDLNTKINAMFDTQQTRCFVYWEEKAVQKSSINYFSPLSILNQETINQTSIAECCERKLLNPDELFFVIDISDKCDTRYGNIHILREDTNNQKVALVALKSIEDLSDIQNFYLYAVVQSIVDDKKVFDKLVSKVESIKPKTDFDFSHWKIDDTNVLPLKELSNLFLEAYTEIYYDNKKYSPEIYGKEHNEKQLLGEKVALINGWKLNSYLKSKNNRLVFEPRNKATGIIKYLSMDTLHSDFEFHNAEVKENNHKGSTAINGNKSKGTQGHQLKFS